MAFDWLSGLGGLTSLLGGIGANNSARKMRKLQLDMLMQQYARQKQYGGAMDNLLWSTITSGGRNAASEANRRQAEADTNDYYRGAQGNLTKQNALMGVNGLQQQNGTLALARARAADMARGRTAQMTADNARADDARNLLFSTLNGGGTADALGNLASSYDQESGQAGQSLFELMRGLGVGQGQGQTTPPTGGTMLPDGTRINPLRAAGGFGSGTFGQTAMPTLSALLGNGLSGWDHGGSVNDARTPVLEPGTRRRHYGVDYTWDGRRWVTALRQHGG